MYSRISKALEGLLARTTFETAKVGARHHLKDWLMLNIMRDDGALASRILEEYLEDWQRYQIALRIERMLGGEGGVELAPEAFYADYAEQLALRFFEARRVSTLHAATDVLGDVTTLSSKVFALYGVTADMLAARIDDGDAERSVEAKAEEPVQPAEPTDGGGTTDGLVARFGCDLTALAREGRLDPVIGRSREIERVVQILSRRKKNNPILVGEAGVGKSAVVEGLALRIVAGDVPQAIAGRKVVSLDVSSLVAGTKFRGEFEERMQQLLDELRRSRDTIIFIDEIHTIVGAGATQGSLDTANILKPALARGEVQTIGATTLDEYRECIERDAALERRFQRVMIEPTTPAETFDILLHIASAYEQHHGVRYSPEALRACVELTRRYITDRNFPDKAIDLMDEAGSRVGHTLRERGTEVNAEDVAQVLTSMTGIAVERITSTEVSRLRALEARLQRDVIGQQEAVRCVARSIRRSRAGLKDENRPIGVFLFAGPTGVGKTLLAKSLARYLFDERDGLVRIDMSEYGEAHNVARLIGSPPGYVGYGEGGQLSEAVRRHPYSVVLLDEIEKAHSDIYNTLLQIFDEGRLTDGSGRTIDFRNTIIILTSNVGSRESVGRSATVGYNTLSKSEVENNAVQWQFRRALEQHFAPEFLNRIDEVVLFRRLDRKDAERIVGLELKGLLARVAALGYKMRVTQGARRALAALGFESRYGARPLKRLLAERVEVPVANMIIDGEVGEGDTIVVEKSGEGVVLKVA